MFFGEDVAAGSNASRSRSGRDLGLVVAGLAATLLLAGCNASSLKETLTTPPPTSSTQNPANATTAGETAAPGAPVQGAESLPGAAGGATASSATGKTQHVGSGHRRRAAGSGKQESSGQQATAPQQGTAAQNAPFVEQGAAKTGTYPNFVPPKAATTPMTDAEKKKFEEMMAERIKANRQQPETPAEAAERERLLKALAAKRGQQTPDAGGSK